MCWSSHNYYVLIYVSCIKVGIQILLPTIRPLHSDYVLHCWLFISTFFKHCLRDDNGSVKSTKKDKYILEIMQSNGLSVVIKLTV